MGERKGVPYDFSIVTRGEFVVIDIRNVKGDLSFLHPGVKRNMKEQAEKMKLVAAVTEVIGKTNMGIVSPYHFSVQINPDQIEITDKPCGDIGFRCEGIMNGMEPPAQIMRKGGDKTDGSTLLLNLKFDVFDEYKITSADGVLPVECDLINDENCALNKLRHLAGSTDMLVYFMWGPIEWVGFIQDVETDFTCFSRWGQPLKATARVHIVQPYFGTDENGMPLRVKDLDITLIRSCMEGKMKVAETIQRAILGASQALR